MILCDIGNSNYKFLINNQIKTIPIDEKFDFKTKKTIYYISVNKKGEKKLLKYFNCKNLDKYIKIKTKYCGKLGIDRGALVYGIKNKIVIDAGSAITIDIVKNGIHLGGYILPGINRFEKSYLDISKKLKFNFLPNLTKIPICTDEAISNGIVGMIKSFILDIKKEFNLDILITGGDGKMFADILDATYKKDLIFKHMKKIVKGIRC